MDTTNLSWLSADGISRSTVAVVIIVIIVLVILLIIRAIIVRRKANEATSLSPDAREHLHRRRIAHSEQGHGHRHHDFSVQAAAPAAIQNKDADPAKLGTIVSVPLNQTKPNQQAHVVQFQQGPVVQAKQVINPQPTVNDQTSEQVMNSTCPDGNCGAQLEATPQLVQAQQNIHNPNREIPAYPQRQQAIRNARAGFHQRRLAQQHNQSFQVANPVQNSQDNAPPKSNYRLQRGREVQE